MYTIKFFTGNDKGLKPSEINDLYRIGDADGTLALVAYDCPELNAHMFETFVRRLSRIGFFAGVYDRRARPVGFFFLSSFEGETARFHFCIFRWASDRRHEIGEKVLENVFRRFKLKSLIGLVPAINPGAAEYCREMGGKEMGAITGACWLARLGRSAGGLQFLFFPKNTEENKWADSEN